MRSERICVRAYELISPSCSHTAVLILVPANKRLSAVWLGKKLKRHPPGSLCLMRIPYHRRQVTLHYLCLPLHMSSYYLS